MSRNGSSSRAVDSHSSRVHGSDGIELSAAWHVGSVEGSVDSG